jgi:D-arabinonate dehydratase
MKIRDVTVTMVEVPLTRIFKGSTYQIDKRCTIIVNIETDEGVTGETYSGDERTTYREIRDLILGPYKNVLVGEDPFAIERIWERLFEITPHVGNKTVAMRALSAVDLALWDVIGKALNSPLYKLIGGHKDELPIIGYGYYEEGQDLEAIADIMVQQKEMGYAGTKLKVGGTSVEEDLKRVDAIRKAVGGEFILACDANRAWTPAEAIRFARGAEGYDIAWLEEPVRWHNEVAGMRRVRESTTIPVTAGQSEISGFGCMDLINGGAVDFLNVDASIAGGVTEWRRIAAAAHFSGVRMVHHEEPQVAIHLLSSIPHSFCAELFPDPDRDPVWHYMFQGHPQAKGGMISPPEGPGLGISIDRDFVEKYQVTG